MTTNEADRRVEGLRRLYDLISSVMAARTLGETLQAVVDGVLRGVGFGVASVNVVRPDGTFETVAVSGPEAARRQLLGSVYPAGDFDVEFAMAERWGSLLWVPHERLPPDELVSGWVPDIDVSDLGRDEDAWHPLDALFAPLRAPWGDLVGMLSVDLPADGRRPGPLQRELLEMFAAQAGIAVHNAILAEQLRLEKERLRASEESFRLAFDGAGVGMSVLAMTGADRARFLRVNEELCRITGRDVESLVGRSCLEIIHPDDATNAAAALDHAAIGPGSRYRADQRYMHADGSLVWVAVTTNVLRDSEGVALHAITQVEDITERKAVEVELARRATHDPLTGLPNRVTLHDRLASAMKRAQDDGPRGAVFFCDLDGFKEINDRLGHAVGDEVLRLVAQRLTGEVREGDLVARLGGDEFVIVAEDIDLPHARVLAERLGAVVEAPIAAGPHVVSVAISVGIAAFSAAAEGPHEVMAQADAAMYRAKASPTGCYAVFAVA